MTARISIIAAIGRRRELGKGNELLWRIPDDLKRFRDLTRGHPVIMGRKTFDSILAARGGPLPDRTNIVITRQDEWAHEGALRAPSLDEAIEIAEQSRPAEIFIIGGAQIYAEALPRADRLLLTIIDDEQEADAFFPPYEHAFREVSGENREWLASSGVEGVRYRFTEWERSMRVSDAW